MTAVDMMPISPLRPPRFEMHVHHIDCVLVSERSVDRWWKFEEEMLDKFQVPRLVGVGANGRETVDAIRSTSLDALLFGEEFADLARTIRLSAGIPLNSTPVMVLAADDISKPVIVRSLACGFDGVV